MKNSAFWFLGQGGNSYGLGKSSRQRYFPRLPAWEGGWKFFPQPASYSTVDDFTSAFLTSDKAIMLDCCW
jgi:hypothetical protein